MQIRSTIRFFLDGELVEIDNVDPTRTVLQYLREDLSRIGSKEGCAEGDCGACTVALVELDKSGTSLQVRAINSCIQFLPVLDGKELVTVESLAGKNGDLHPLQKALVDCHGSQCGFCTPGFVMSLFAMYKTQSAPSRRDIDDALAGNLCRCTGYQPIIDAALKMYALSENESAGWLRTAAGASASDHERMNALKALDANDTLCVAGSGRTFFAPRSLDELANLYVERPSATLLAGGTDVGLWVTKQHRDLATVIYTGAVAELADISITTTNIEIGAAATLTDAMQAIVDHYPSLNELFVRFASPPIRNAGTLGGNIANGSPIGDSMPALLALDTKLLLRRGAETRSVALEVFYLDYMQNALQPGEFVQKVLLPLPASDEIIACYKVSKRFDQDISALCGAYWVQINHDRVADVRVAYGGMAAIPLRARACENALRGEIWNEVSVTAAATALEEDFEPLSDMRSSASYRQQVARNLLQRFYFEASGGESARVYDYGR